VSAAAAEPAAGAPLVSTAEPKTEEPKKRNVVVRVLGRVFGKKTPPAPAAATGSKGKPAGAPVGPHDAQ